MGLMICKNIIEANRGTLTVKSEGENCGSSFLFTMQMFTEMKDVPKTYIENENLDFAERNTQAHFMKTLDATM